MDDDTIHIAIEYYNTNEASLDLLNWGPIEYRDVSSITGTQLMFSKFHLFNRDISGWDVRSVTDMSLMFNEKSMRFLCEQHSLIIDDINYPYLEDIYSNIEDDYNQVKNIINGKSITSTPFWGAIMRVVISQK